MNDLTTLGLKAFNQPFIKLGDTQFSASSMIFALVFIFGIWWLASFVERSVLRIARRRASEPGTGSRIHVLSRLLRYAIWMLGTLVGLNQVGIDLTSIALIGSALAVGLGFGLQNVISNFVSGIIILVEGSLKVGDFVDLESGVRGHVREIAMRYSRITTNDSIDVLVPNSEFVNKRVVNWTFDDSLRRIRIPFGVAYGTDKEIVRDAGIAAARNVPEVLDFEGKRSAVWLISYGDNSMNFELVVWADRALTTHPASAHAKLMWALDDELQRRGIDIPFPQRDLHVRSGTLDVRLSRAEKSKEEIKPE